MVNELYPFQQECVDTVDALPDGSRSIVNLATGLGKSFTASRFKANGHVLWLSHRDELVRQPEKYFTSPKYTDKPRTFGIEKAGEHGNGEDVISASTLTLAKDKRLEAYPPDYFDLIICDEAHHAAAKTYVKILQYFKPRKLIGLTATPRRGDKVRLTDVFDSICYTKDLKWGIENGYLSRIRCLRVTAEFDLKKTEVREGDITAGSLSREMECSDNASIVTRSYMEHGYAGQRKSLIFCPTVAVCNTVHEAIREALPEDMKDTVRVLTDKDPDDERKAMLKDYMETDRVMCIINCMILTEGTDLPMTDLVIIDRPTANPTLYTQMVGRGTRTYKNKNYCLIIDVLGKNADDRNVCTTPTLFGFDPSVLDKTAQGMLENGDLLTQINKIEDKDSEGSIEGITLKKQLVDLFTGRKTEIIDANSAKGLVRIAACYEESLEDAREETKMFGDLMVKLQPEDSLRYMITATYHGTICLSKPDVLGKSYITVNIPADESKDKKEIKGVSREMPIETAIDTAKDILGSMTESKYRFKWSKVAREKLNFSPASNSQMNYIHSLYPEIEDGGKITKLMACDLIDLKTDIDTLKKQSIRLGNKLKAAEGGTQLVPLTTEEPAAWKDIMLRKHNIESGADMNRINWGIGGAINTPLSRQFEGTSTYAMTAKQLGFMTSIRDAVNDRGSFIDIDLSHFQTNRWIAGLMIDTMMKFKEMTEKGNGERYLLLLSALTDQNRLPIVTDLEGNELLTVYYRKAITDNG